jgi:O-antigen/teichoic acid export membrane protein
VTLPPPDSALTSETSARLVARNFVALGLGESAARLIGFIAMLVVARRVGASIYGVIGVATAVVLYANRVVDGGIELGLGVREVARDPGHLDRFLPSIITMRLVVASVLVVLASIVGLMVLPQPDGATITILALTLIAVGGGTRWVHIGLHQSHNAALAMTLGQAAAAVLMISLVHGPGDVARVPAFVFTGEALTSLLLLWWLGPSTRRLKAELRLEVLRPLIPRASALVVSALLGIVIYNANFIFLRVFRDAAAVGYFNAAYTLVTFFLNVGTAYSLSLLPSLTRLRSVPEEQHRLYGTAMAQVFTAGVPVAIGGSLLSIPIIGLLFGAAYRPAAWPFVVLIWCIPFCLIRDIPVMALQAAGREDKILRVTLAAALLNLALNAVLIPRWGIRGAAVATLATEIVRMGVALSFVAGEGFGIAWISRFWRSLVAAGVMVGVLLLTGEVPLVPRIALGGTAYLAVLTGVGGLRFRRRALPVLTV